MVVGVFLMRTGIIDGIVGTPIKVEINPHVEVNPNIEIVTPPEVTDALLCIKWTLMVIAVLLLIRILKK
jgi:hypothetical protein